MPRKRRRKFVLAVRTIEKLLPVEFIASREQKAARRPGAVGLVVELVDQGALGTAYLVEHPGEQTPAIYMPDEIESTPAFWRLTYSLEGEVHFKEFDDYREMELFIVDEDNGVSSPTIEGPFFSEKALEEGKTSQKSLFDHLTNEDV